MSNLDVIKLHNAGFTEQVIIEKITTSPNNFILDADRLIELKRAGVSEAIISAMLKASQR